MELLAGGGAALGGSSVPAFLTKLWTLVEDPDTDPLICWSPNGTSFHVFDHGRFSKEVLPKFFKHNNMASFVRQLNMYGFRKVVHIEHGGLVKPEKDDTEFQHPFFVRGQEQLLENIKRKVTNVASVRQEEVKMSPEEVTKILSDVQIMKGRQETIDSKIIAMKHENEALWREVATLRQKHVQQQKVVNKLLQFLVSLVQSNRVMGMKRKMPLMLSDSTSANSMPKYSRQFSLEHLQGAPAISGSGSVFPGDALLNSGPIISDITELATPTTIDITSDWTDAEESPLVHVKEEGPSSPEVEDGATPVDTPLSPNTFINSILQEDESNSAQNPSTANPLAAPANQSPSSALPSSPTRTQQKCLSVACIDRGRRKPSKQAKHPVWENYTQKDNRSVLSEHVETIDYDLENLQNILNTQTLNFESSPLFELLSSSSTSGDFDLESLDTLLSSATKAADEGNNATDTGKQLVQYMATPTAATEPSLFGDSGSDLPSLLEMEPYFSAEPDPSAEDLTLSLLTSSDIPTHSHAHLDPSL